MFPVCHVNHIVSEKKMSTILRRAGPLENSAPLADSRHSILVPCWQLYRNRNWWHHALISDSTFFLSTGTHFRYWRITLDASIPMDITFTNSAPKAHVHQHRTLTHRGRVTHTCFGQSQSNPHPPQVLNGRHQTIRHRRVWSVLTERARG